jgi:hypothetical protein
MEKLSEKETTTKLDKQQPLHKVNEQVLQFLRKELVILLIILLGGEGGVWTGQSPSAFSLMVWTLGQIVVKRSFWNSTR